MSTSRWRPLDVIDFAQMRTARLQAHYAAQWLARTARAYIPPEVADGHTNLGWDSTSDAFITHPLPDGTQVRLRISYLTLALLDRDGKPLELLPLDGLSDADVRQWLGRQMQARGLPAEKLDDPLPYDLPPHALAHGAAYAPAALGTALSELTAWFANGYQALSGMRQSLLARGLAAGEICCWPHHFDLDCLTTIGEGAPYVAPTMGAGFSPGDQNYDQPYFYISVYPRPAALPTLPPPGHWHTEDFVAAVLPASRILALKDRQAETEAFLQTAADAIVKVIGAGAAARSN